MYCLNHAITSSHPKLRYKPDTVVMISKPDALESNDVFDCNEIWIRLSKLGIIELGHFKLVKST